MDNQTGAVEEHKGVEAVIQPIAASIVLGDQFDDFDPLELIATLGTVKQWNEYFTRYERCRRKGMSERDAKMFVSLITAFDLNAMPKGRFMRVFTNRLLVDSPFRRGVRLTPVGGVSTYYMVEFNDETAELFETWDAALVAGGFEADVT